MSPFTGKKILVFGLARSGVGAANLLFSLGADVTVTDLKTEAQLHDAVQRLAGGVKLLLGRHPSSPLGLEMIVVSPGVPLSLPFFADARRAAIPVVGELELAYQALRGVIDPPGFLAVTGTNGKSTATTLLDLMVRKSGFRALLGGNIGNALSEEVHKVFAEAAPGASGSRCLPPLDYVVVEVSSFQLESIDHFRPKGAAILNVTPDHLDRYPSMKEYAAAKARIFENQGRGDFLVLNADDGETMKLGAVHAERDPDRMPRHVFFSRRKAVEGVFVLDGVVRCGLPGIYDGAIMRADEIRITGVHNLENAMAASAMALLAGCSPEVVADVLRTFPGLEHRMESVRVLDGVSYINDSKGTNVAAVMKSLEGGGPPVILIAGGRDKAGEFGALREVVGERVKALVLIGEAAGKLRAALGDLVETVDAPDLAAAVFRARELARPGDMVLLSPACASFDMFTDFEDRGRRFKDLVRGME